MKDFVEILKAARAAPRSRAAAKPARAVAAKGPAVAARRQAVESQPRVPAGQPNGGQWTSKDFVQTLRSYGLPADDAAAHGLRILGPSNERAFAGQRVAIPKPFVFGGPGKQNEVGDRAEALALDYVRQKISPAAALLKEKGSKNNLPFDVAAYVPGKGVVLYEVKGGQPSNDKGAWQWRVTLDYRITAEQKKKIGKMSEADLRAYQMEEAHKRKAKMLRELDKQLQSAGLLPKGERVHVDTIGVIFDAHRKVADVHVMPDVHQRTGWTSERAQHGYRGTFRIKVEKAKVADVIAEWGDALEADLMAMIPDLVRRISTLLRKPGPPLAEITVVKMAPERRYFAGWASIIEQGGEPVVDTQNHIIEEHELIAAADEFMRSFRVGKVLHQGEPDKVEYVESVVFTKDVQQALGVDLGKVGWWVGGYAKDDATWQAIKDGRLRSLSIGGKAQIVDA